MFAVLMAMLSIAFTCQWNGCEGKPKREYASLILYDNYQGEWVFDVMNDLFIEGETLYNYPDLNKIIPEELLLNNNISEQH